MNIHSLIMMLTEYHNLYHNVIFIRKVSIFSGIEKNQPKKTYIKCCISIIYNELKPLRIE